MLQGVVVPKSSEWVQKRPAFYGRWQQGSLRALCVKGNKYARISTHTTHNTTHNTPSLHSLEFHFAEMHSPRLASQGADRRGPHAGEQ
jgi:hypothetical protein